MKKLSRKRSSIGDTITSSLCIIIVIQNVDSNNIDVIFIESSILKVQVQMGTRSLIRG